MNFRSATRRRAEAALDLTPLIDAMFLLLVFFLVTATLARTGDESTIPVALPEARSGSDDLSAPAGVVTVFLEADGTLRVRPASGREVATTDIPALRERLALLRANDPSAVLHLRGDRDVAYGRVMAVLDVARQAGFPEIVNIVQAP